MFTSDVAKLLGVSQSTIQRWVKQLNLPMEKNERGHYLFKQDDIELLKEVKEQIQKGVLLQDINPPSVKKPRKGFVKASDNEVVIEKLVQKIANLEMRLNEKADSVTSYQLLQHRNEMEEMQKHINTLMDRIQTLEDQVRPTSLENPILLDQPLTKISNKRKRKNIVSSLFGL
jgi:chromosome-anchoring protein RacA